MEKEEKSPLSALTLKLLAVAGSRMIRSTAHACDVLELDEYELVHRELMDHRISFCKKKCNTSERH